MKQGLEFAFEHFARLIAAQIPQRRCVTVEPDHRPQLLRCVEDY